ncbi:MAG: hypothetical protein QF702_06695 [Prochlorococcaceae cyanobacterium ETNP2_MAG_10]|nr:hypothetical protein [Prochlorococcaceae cyanobacterium ETNP2_MAG_10]
MTFLHRICLLISLASALFCISEAQSLTQSSEEENPIKMICLMSFKAAMADAGKTPPEGMGQFTCKCFLNQVNAGASIGTAQSVCKVKAAAHYNL